MFTLTVALASSAMHFHYEKRADAMAAADSLGWNPSEAVGALPFAEIKDDFHRTARVQRSAVVATMVEEWAESSKVAIKQAVHNAKAQMAAQKEVQSDPSMRFNMGNGMGPIIDAPRRMG